ncbi:PDZ and LIM domain protein 1 [Plecturocebus cupreus]
MPFTASPASSTTARVVTNYISNFNNTLESKTAAASKVEANGRPLDHAQPPSSLVINKESEVYKMLQEKQQLNESLKQSTSFLVLQESLESE